MNLKNIVGYFLKLGIDLFFSCRTNNEYMKNLRTNVEYLMNSWSLANTKKIPRILSNNPWIPASISTNTINTYSIPKNIPSYVQLVPSLQIIYSFYDNKSAYLQHSQNIKYSNIFFCSPNEYLVMAARIIFEYSNIRWQL